MAPCLSIISTDRTWWTIDMKPAFFSFANSLHHLVRWASCIRSNTLYHRSEVPAKTQAQFNTKWTLEVVLIPSNYVLINSANTDICVRNYNLQCANYTFNFLNMLYLKKISYSVTTACKKWSVYYIYIHKIKRHALYMKY